MSLTLIRRAILSLALIAGIAPAFAQAPPPVPALPDTERRTTYSISGTTCACAVNFALYGDSTDYANWLEVFINGVLIPQSGNWTITSPTGPLATIPRPITDAILTFTAAQTGTVQIVGARRPRRTAQFAENRGVAARDLNQALTDIIAQNRETWDKINDVTGRGFFVPPGQTGSIISGGLGTGNVIGPTPTVAGNIALWNNATGTLLKDAGGGSPSHPVTHPSSGNLFGAGCITAEAHSVWWVDQNLCSTADVWQIASSDPSAVFSLNLTGTITAGDTVSLTITMGSGLCSGAGCTVTSGPLTGGDSIGTLSGKLACAVANNASLFNLNGAVCTSGVVSGTSWGGYANANPIGLVVLTGAGVAWDFNSNISMKVTASVSGAATEIVTFNNTTCGTRCSYSLDNNPALQFSRISGSAPQPGSTLAAIYSIGATSACPTSTCLAYGSITNWVANSTAGAIQSAWLMATPNTAGSLAAGTWFGQGAFSNFGGAPFATGSMLDQGAGTFNAGTCYWIGAAVGGYAGDSICRAGSLMALQTSGDAITISSGAGVGINATPTGVTFTSNLGAFFAGTQVPTTGSGVSIAGGATPVITSENYGTSAFLPLVFASLNYDFKPSGSATSGWTLQANKLAPDADNVTQLGDGTHNISTVFAKSISGLTTPLSVAQGGTGDSGTAWGAYTPSPSCGTATFAVTTARSKTLGKTTFVEGDFTITAIGTCTNIVNFNLPLTANSAGVLPGFEATRNIIVTCNLSGSGSTSATCLLPAVANYALNDHLKFSGVYENQ